MSNFKGTKIKELLRACSELEARNYLGGNFTPSLVSVENEVDSLIKQHNEMLEMLESVVAMFAKGQILTVDRVVKKRDEINQLIKSATEL